MARFFVMAQTAEHARYWAESHGIRREEYCFYNRPYDLSGYESPFVVVYETAYRHRDFTELLHRAYARRARIVNPDTGEIHASL